MTEPVFTDPNAGRIATPSAPRPVDTTRTDAATGRLADTLLKFGEALYRQEQDQVVLRARVDMSREYQDLALKASSAATVEETQKIFNKGSAAIQTEIAGRSIDGRTQDSLGILLEQAGLKAQAEVTKNITQRKAGEYLGDMADLANEWQKESLGMSDEDAEELKDRFDGLGRGAVNSGAMGQGRAAPWVIKQRSQVDYNRASLLVAQNPVAAYTALLDKERYPDMTADQRRSLLVSSLNRLSQGENAEAKALKQKQEAEAMKMWDLVLDNKLTPDALKAARTSLSKTDFATFTRRLTSPDSAPKTNPVVHNRLLADLFAPGADRSQVRSDILAANANGGITGATANSLLTKNLEMSTRESTGEGDTPADMATRYFQTITKTEGRSLTGSVEENGLLGQARLEFDLFIKTNPDATIGVLQEEANEIAFNWKLADIDSKSKNWPRPWGMIGFKHKYTMADLINASKELNREFKKGLIDPEEYTKQRKNHARWKPEIIELEEAQERREERKRKRENG